MRDSSIKQAIIGSPEVCILSDANLEETTDQVMDWLRCVGVRVIRLNGQDITGQGRYSFHLTRDCAHASLMLSDDQFEPRHIKVVWYRRWSATHLYERAIIGDGVTWQSKMTIARSLRRELSTVSRFLFSLLDSARWLGNPFKHDPPNKLTVLRLAQQHGLDVPDTFVSNDADELRKFAQEHSGAVITKSLGESLFLVKPSSSARWGFDIFSTYTSVPSQSDIQQLRGKVFPILLQECLYKEYEIRTFYLDGATYSTAIFSQSNPQTRTDYHRYDYKKPARMVPYRLPESLQLQVRGLMRSLSLDTGSIDFIRTQDDRIVFLEVNPNGQFGVYSELCNYYLEKKVAEAIVRRLRDDGRSEE